MSNREDCKELRADVEAFCDGELAPERRSRVEAHLRRCQSCTELRDELRALRDAVQSMPLDEPSSARLWEGVDRSLRPPWWSPPRLLGQSRGERAVRAVAGIVLALALGYGYAWVVRTSVPEPVVSARPPIALTVGDYVEAAEAGASESFWRRYSAVETSDVTTVAAALEFRPWTPDRLPGGYRLVGTRLLKDACCYTLHLRYESDRGALDLFQCHQEHPVTYGRARMRRTEQSGGSYTDLDWQGSAWRGRAFGVGELQLVVIGDMSAEAADRIVEAARRGAAEPRADG